MKFFTDLKRRDHKPAFGGLEIFKYIGPGLLVTVGFIDPGNWASTTDAIMNSIRKLIIVGLISKWNL